MKIKLIIGKIWELKHANVTVISNLYYENGDEFNEKFDPQLHELIL